MAGGSAATRAKLAMKRKSSAVKKRDDVAGQPLRGKQNKAKVARKSGKAKPENRNNSKVPDSLVRVPDGILPPTQAIIDKVIPDFIGTQTRRRRVSSTVMAAQALSDQLDEIDHEFAASDGVALTVDPDEDLDFPESGGNDQTSGDNSSESEDEGGSITPVQQQDGSEAISEVQFSNNLEDFESLRGNPAFETYLRRVAIRDFGAGVPADGPGEKCNGDCEGYAATPNQPQHQFNVTPKRSVVAGSSGHKMIKSPSDTTIYAPAFAQPLEKSPIIGGQAMQIVQSPNQIQAIGSDCQTLNQRTCDLNLIQNAQDNNLVNHIIQFIEGI